GPSAHLSSSPLLKLGPPSSAFSPTHWTRGGAMAIPLPPVLKGPGPFVDSSNRTEPLARLRPASSYTSSPRKSPPTRTVSLASVTASPRTLADSEPFPAASPASFVLFPNVDLPSEGEESEGACGGEHPVAEPWRRPRARPSHVQPPRRAQPPPMAPISKRRRPKPATAARAARADLRFAALIERSISQALRDRSVNPDLLAMDAGEGSDELDAQDALLAARLRVSLARQGWRRPASVSPSRWTPAARPASVLLSGSTSVLLSESSDASPGAGVSFPEGSTSASTSTPAPVAPLLVSRAARARSGSRGINGTPETLPLPALVATLLLRRHNEPHISSSLSLDTGVRARVRARVVDPSALAPSTRRPSPLSQAVYIIHSS
ncbi:hypothetical protein FB451DRAFT_1468010, partial [Mycena latifolia]